MHERNRRFFVPDQRFIVPVGWTEPATPRMEFQPMYTRGVQLITRDHTGLVYDGAGEVLSYAREKGEIPGCMPSPPASASKGGIEVKPHTWVMKNGVRMTAATAAYLLAMQIDVQQMREKRIGVVS